MNIKLGLAFAATIVVMEVFAQESTNNLATVQQKLLKQSAVASKVGGLVCKPSVGRVVFYTAQNEIPRADIDRLSREFSGQIKTQIGVATCEGFSVMSAPATMKKDGTTVAVFMISDDKLPMSLVAMEQRWAMINVYGMKSSDVTDSVAANRLKRQISRTFKALFSGVNVMKGQKAVAVPSDLDSIKSDPIDGQTLVGIVHGLPSYGIVPSKLTTYKRACMEGWAPAPTNEIQKAVWDEVHERPTQPMKIKYNPKRGK